MTPAGNELSAQALAARRAEGFTLATGSRRLPGTPSLQEKTKKQTSMYIYVYGHIYIYLVCVYIYNTFGPKVYQYDILWGTWSTTGMQAADRKLSDKKPHKKARKKVNQ